MKTFTLTEARNERMREVFRAIYRPGMTEETVKRIVLAAATEPMLNVALKAVLDHEVGQRLAAEVQAGRLTYDPESDTYTTVEVGP